MDANVVVTQIGSTAIFVWAYQKLKLSPYFPVITEKTAKWAKIAVSAVAAFFIHGGIGYVWDPHLDANGNRQLVLSIPAYSVIALNLWHTLCQYIFQESWYQAFYNKFGMVVPGVLPAPQPPQGVKP